VALAATAAMALSAYIVFDMNSLAIIRESDGKVVTFVRPDQPQGWKPPAGTRAVAESDLLSDWQMAEPQPQGDPITAEEAVAAYFSPYQIQALARLEMALLQAGKPLGPQMLAAKTWLEGVMLAWALNPVAAPAESFGQPQATFAEASAEAVAGLQQNPEA
jgi:hypothetical protein